MVIGRYFIYISKIQKCFSQKLHEFSISNLMWILILNVYGLMECSRCMRTYLEVLLVPIRACRVALCCQTNSIYSPVLSPSGFCLVPTQTSVAPTFPPSRINQRVWLLSLIYQIHAVSDGWPHHFSGLVPTLQSLEKGMDFHAGLWDYLSSQNAWGLGMRMGKTVHLYLP